MTTRPVHWHEGMFIRPQHFQTAQRYWASLVDRCEEWDVHYNWGLRAIDLDLDALANYRASVRSLKARLHDGTLLSVPEDVTLAPVDLKPAFAQANPVDILLAVPVLQLGRPNAATAGSAADTRYLVDTQETEDENTGGNPQAIQVRLLNARLLLSTDDPAGYEVLRLARVQKSARAEAVPELDKEYIPPLLACDAWRPLAVGILQTLYDRVGQMIKRLAELVVARGITFDSQAQGDAVLFAQLRELNEAHALLRVLVFAEGVHPLWAYLELCRMVGQMAIFTAARRPPELPRYDHDDLGTCFWRAKRILEGQFNFLPPPPFHERAFEGAGLRMQVALEPAWLESTWQMFLGVQSPTPPQQLIALLTTSGRNALDMKIASSERVDEIFRMGKEGLRVTHCPRPPRALPSLAGLNFFQILREANAAEWQHVQRSLALAIRLNEGLIVGDIQGQRVLTVQAGSRKTTMQFTLYVVPPEKASA
jgi:type VI secretion system protein ImpJ